MYGGWNKSALGKAEIIMLSPGPFRNLHAFAPNALAAPLMRPRPRRACPWPE